MSVSIERRSASRGRLAKVGLIVGFLALLVGVLAARGRPATGYELSLYTQTPTVFWGGVGVAVAAGGLAALGARGRARDGGLVLTGLSILSVAALPIVRGYYFYGAGDSLSHLGWAREIAAGALEPTNLLYPGVHTTTVFVGAVFDVPLTTAMLYVVLVAYMLVFVLFVPLCVQLLDGSRRAVAIGLLGALLFIPINNVSVHPFAHPASQAILFFPFVLYLTLRYVTRRPWAGSAPDSVTAIGVLLAVTTSAVVLIHPQQALNVVVVFVAIVAVQVVYRVWRSGHPITSHRPLYAQTALLVVVFALWAPRFQRVRGSASSTILGLLGQGPTAGEVVTQKSVSIAAIGGNIGALFFKLFFPALVFSLLAAGLMVYVVRGRLDDDRRDANALLVYLTVALVPLFLVFLLLVVSATGDMYFRYQGFIMVPVTVLGAVAVSRALRRAGEREGRSPVRALVAVGFVVLLTLSMVAFHPSPYIYQPTPQVTERQAEGYTATFVHRAPGVEFIGVRGGPRRFVDAAYGTQRARTTLQFPGYEDVLVPGVFNRANYTSAFGDRRYMAVSSTTYAREVGLYDGFRYEQQGFDALDASPGVSRVRTNGGFTLYLIDGRDR